MTSTKGLSDADLYLRYLRESGLEPIDRQGRLKVPLGNGFDSQLAKAIYPIQQRRVPYQSRYLDNRDFLRLYKGVATANYNGWILNTFATVSWSLAGLTDHMAAAKAQQAFQERMTSWFAYQRKQNEQFPPYAGIWVKEVGRAMGLHTHFLLHVPSPVVSEFGRWARKSIASATDTPRTPIRRTKRGQPLYVTDVCDLDMSIDGQWNVFRYMAKGVDPDELAGLVPHNRRRVLLSEYAGLRAEDQGTVLGQRCGRSSAISDSAFHPWRVDYEKVLDSERRNQGKRSYHFGSQFYYRGEVSRQLADLGI
ncbi:MAG: hypothetical protein ACOVQ0_00930 [Novosphingobium sp.]|uniref:hypothetical protein n=1 Tax=Novosphingobium sp. TaxID=1874826 RepID=UPI003B9C9DED